MKGVIRPAAPHDAEAIRKIHLSAFSNVAEADLVAALSDSDDVVASLVYDMGAKVVGHIVLSRMEAIADDKPVKAAALAPIAVSPDNQRGGIGTLLIRRAIEEAKAQGNQLIFLLGDPAYYARFGFDVQKAEPFQSRYSGPFFQVLVLEDSFILPNSGKADYAPAFAALEGA